MRLNFLFVLLQLMQFVLDALSNKSKRMAHTTINITPECDLFVNLLLDVLERSTV